jgi:hypothetical protein
MNWTEEDLAKPQVLVESADGMGHPGTFHFRSLIDEVSNGVYEAGGKPGVFTVSDICDGVVQATAGMSYSLVSRDIMAAMVEIHALGHPHDGMVLISGNDKSVPAHLVAMARCDLPAIHLPGGTQLNAPDYVTSNEMWAKETHHLIGEPELRRMKPTAFLVNTARGPIVSDEALYRGLREGWIAGAGLDDIEEEPAKQRDWKPVNPLLTLPNIVVTPHAAYYSEEAIHTVRDFAAREVVRVLTGQPPVSPVNADQLTAR